MDHPLTLGYSTCPNDTFIFYAMAHGKVDCGDVRFDVQLADVETLNQQAGSAVLDISKLSFAAIGHLQETYGLLRSGAALGKGCGPLLVAKPGFDMATLSRRPVAVPGLWTTACMLLGLFAENRVSHIPMSFDRIMPAVVSGEVAAGVIIHEGRFTYEGYGLESYMDLGQWWEDTTGLPIPLGGIGIRRDIPVKTVEKVDRILKESILYASLNRAEADNYISAHAQEMAPDVIDQHIGLYVNDFTLDIGEEGQAAIETLFKKAREKGMLPDSDLPVLAY